MSPPACGLSSASASAPITPPRVTVGRSGASKRRASPSRAANSNATLSSCGRRAANSSAADEASSSQCASSTTASTGDSPAASANRLSVPRNARNRSPSPAASPSAAPSAARCGAGRATRRARSGHSSRCRAANASGDSDSTPEVRSTRMPAAASTASVSSVDLPTPATPRTTSAPPFPARAASSSAAIAPRSESRPANTGPTVPTGPDGSRIEPGDFTGVSDLVHGDRGSRPTTPLTRRKQMSAHSAVDPHTHQAPGPHGHHPASPPTDEPRRPWTTFGVMISAQVMVILDVSVVNVALPSVSRGLHLSAADYQWAISAYVLLSGGLLLLGGRIADLINRRRAFLTGVGLFTAASLASGLAQTPMWLVLARAAQGAGAALLTPAALSIIMTTYAGKQRQTALAVWGTVGSLGIAAGVLFGGVLTTALGWRAVFFINVPIGIAVVLGTLHGVARGSSRTGALRRLDVPGALTLVTGLLALVLGIEGTRSAGWTAPRTWGALVVAA